MEYSSIIVSVIAALAYTTFFARYLSVLKPKQLKTWEQAKERFFNELTSRISLGVVRGIDDSEQIYRTVANEIDSTRFRSTSLDVLLESYLCIITDQVAKEDKQKAKEQYGFVQQLIDEKRAADPFSVLPATERVTAHMLQEAIVSGETDSAQHRLQELASSLGSRLDESDKRATRNQVISIGALLVAVTAIPISFVF